MRKNFAIAIGFIVCNVKVTRPTNYMISTCDHSHDLPTWSRYVTTHMTYPHDLDTWPIWTSSQHQVIIDTNIRIIIPMTTSGSFRHVRATSTSTPIFQWWWRERRFSLIAINESHWEITSRSTPIQIPVVVAWEGLPRSLLIKATGGLTSRSTPIQDPVVVVWEGSPRSLLIKATGGSHGEWWAGRLARRSISPTLEDVNISFNHPPYYPMGRGDGRVVTDKRVAW